MRTRLVLLAVALLPALALAAELPPPAAGPEPGTSASPTAGAAPAADPAAAPAQGTVEPTAMAQPPAATAEPLPAPPPPPPPPEAAPFPKLGVALGLGVPNGIGLAVLYRPIPWLRFALGPSWDYAGWGVNGGVVFSPIHWAVSPTLGLEGGQYRGADLTKYASSASAEVQPLLRDVRLQYLAATLGLEFGSQRGFAVDLRAGLAYLQVASHGASTFAGGGTSSSGDAVVSVTNPTFRGTAPTVQLAFQYFF